ncbi:MAG: hypothetical protein WCA35_30975, partial [Kovacikia sp.]
MTTNRCLRGTAFLGPFALLMMTATVSHAQQVFSQPIQQLPESPQQSSDQPMISVPPPSVPVPQNASPASSPDYPGETVFQAPNSLPRGNPGRYLVYVNGDSPYLLQQVRTVEPKAFVQQYQGRQVIQVGTFSDETNAQRQVEALKSQGVMAELANTPASSYPYLPPSVASSSNPYPPSGVANTPIPYPPSGTPDANSYPSPNGGPNSLNSY